MVVRELENIIKKRLNTGKAIVISQAYPAAQFEVIHRDNFENFLGLEA